MASFLLYVFWILNTIFISDAYSSQHALIRREQNRAEEYGNDMNRNMNEHETFSHNNGRRHVMHNSGKRNNYFSGMMDMMDSIDDDTDSDSGDTDKYSEKKQVVAFVLSFLLGGLGAGRFYVGDYGLASLKLIFGLILCCSPLIFFCCTLCSIGSAIGGAASAVDEQGNIDDQAMFSSFARICAGGYYGMIGICLICCLGVGYSAWCITDIILFAINSIPDGDGLTLKPM